MGLIDIKKLNEEVDKMIARQDEELKEIKAKHSGRQAERYLQMVTSFEVFANAAHDIGAEIQLKVDMDENSPYAYYIRFKPDYTDKYCIRKYYLANKYDYWFGFEREYASLCWSGDTLDGIIDWWWENAAEFEHRFEEACVKYIKKKAERANNEYAKAKAKYGK